MFSKNNEYFFGVYLFMGDTIYIWFGLIWFYGISTIIGHLIANPFDTYIKYDFLPHFLDKIFKQAWPHFLHAVKSLPIISTNSV